MPTSTARSKVLLAVVLASDLVLLVVAAVVAVPVMLAGARISRPEGGVFVVGYVGYLAWLLATCT